MADTSWLRPHLKQKILQTRGGHSFGSLLKVIDELDHDALQDMWNFLKNLEDSAEDNTRNRMNREPWRRF